MSTPGGPAGERALPRVLAGAAGLCLAAAFCVAFVAFGGRSLSWVVVLSSVLVALAAALLGLADALGPSDALGQRPRGAAPRAAIVAALALVVFGGIGLLPLPRGIVERLAPRRAATLSALPAGMDDWAAAAQPRARSLSELLADDDAALTEHDGGAPGPTAAPWTRAATSHDPGRTRHALVVLAAWLVGLMALASRSGGRFGLRLLAVVVPVVAAGAAYGVFAHHAGLVKVYGLFPPPPATPHAPYGTFFSPNHFSGLCAALAPFVFAAVLSRSLPLVLRLGALLCLGPLTLAVLDAGSRGGLLAGGAGAVLLGLFLLRRRGLRLVGAGLVALSLVALTLAFTVFAERLIHETFAETTAVRESNALRLEYYRLQAGMARENPLVGVGLGAFPVAHQVWKRTEESAVPHHGESDWCEITAELGLPGALAWLVLALALLAGPLRLIIAGRAPPLLAGLLAASGATLLHAAVDFHHREPAVAIVSVLLLATAHAWARSEREPGPGAERPWAGIALGAAACASLLGVLVVGIPDARYEHAAAAAELALAEGEAGAAREAAALATRERPDRGDGWALLAAAEELLARQPGKERAAHRSAAIAASVQAVRAAPATLGAARRAGSLLLAAGATAEAEAATRLALVVSGASSPTRQLAGEVALHRGRRAEALGHLAFAYNGVPLRDVARHSDRLGRLLLEASGGSAPTVLAAVPGALHRVFLLSSWHRAEEDEALRRGLTALADGESLAAAEAETLSGALLLSRGPESARLAHVLLPKLTSAPARARAGMALADGGQSEEALAVLREGLRSPGYPPEAFLRLAALEGAAGRGPEAAAALAAGTAAHPANVALQAAAEKLAAAGAGPAATE